MNLVSKFALLSAAGSLFFSTIAGDARASTGDWQHVAQGATVVAQQAVSLFGSVFALAGSPVAGGYHLQSPVDIGSNTPLWVWQNQGGAVGTSITISQNAQLWLVGTDSVVWQNSNGNWLSHPSNTCDGNIHVMINQPPPGEPHNTIAVARDANANDQIYVVSDGTTRWWNGNCWGKMPNLPSGSAMDVAIDRTHPGLFPWVLNTVGNIYRWDGSQWIAITSGTGKGLTSSAELLGSDGGSIWSFDGSSFSQLFWNSGAIRYLGTATFTSGAQWSQVLVAADGSVWGEH